MLQLNTTICYLTGRFTPRLCWRFSALFTTTQSLTNEIVNTAQYTKRTALNTLNNVQQNNFNELKMTVSKSLHPNCSIIPKIENAQNVHELLNVIKMPYLTREEILKVMNTIISWIHNDNEKISHLNQNKQLLKDKEQVTNVKQVQDVEQVINAKTDSDIENSNFHLDLDLSTSAMVQEIFNLNMKKERNVKLLRVLYDNILQYNSTLNFAECSSLTFSMAALKYPCNKLLDKVSLDIMKTSHKANSSRLHSILKSMAILRYKNEQFLKYVSNIILDSEPRMSQKQIINVFQSFALLGYESEELNQIIMKYMPQLSSTTLGHDEWLNTIWSLAILGSLQPEHAMSVLNNKFITNVMSKDANKNVPKQLKLLNINGIVQHTLNYNGPFLDYSKVPPIACPQSKEKQLYITLLQNTLQSMLPQSSFKMNVNTKMGFSLDAECTVDNNFQAINVNNNGQTNIKKMAIMVNDYHSYCLESDDFQGISKLYDRLLKASGYRVLNVSYKHFGLEDTPSKHVNVLKRRAGLIL